MSINSAYFLPCERRREDFDDTGALHLVGKSESNYKIRILPKSGWNILTTAHLKPKMLLSVGKKFPLNHYGQHPRVLPLPRTEN
jgi:hypothetical protein